MDVLLTACIIDGTIGVEIKTLILCIIKNALSARTYSEPVISAQNCVGLKVASDIQGTIHRHRPAYCDACNCPANSDARGRAYNVQPIRPANIVGVIGKG